MSIVKYEVALGTLEGTVNGFLGNNMPQSADRVMAAASAIQVRVAALEGTLRECLEYFEGREDVEDGPHGVPVPNREMRLAGEIARLLP